jgi:hypothetical protein
MPRTGGILVLYFLFLFFPFAFGPTTALAALNEQGDSALDPKTTTLERVGDKLTIRTKQPDGSVKEMVKDLLEIKPGSDFFHWTVDPDAPNWMRTGIYPKANLEPLKVPTNNLQAYGPGFYVSQSPVDSADFGDILTHFQVPARPRGFLGGLEGKARENFWVLKEPLFFRGDTTEERNKLAQPTYELLKKAGIAGCQVNGANWYTFFDEQALTGFSQPSGETFMQALIEHKGQPATALDKLSKIPANRPILDAISSMLEKKAAIANSLDEERDALELAMPLHSAKVDQAMKARVLTLLQTSPGMAGQRYSAFLQWANGMDDGPLFNQLFDFFLAKSPDGWSDPYFQQMLGNLMSSMGKPAIKTAILERVTNGIKAIQPGAEGATAKLHAMYSTVRIMGPNEAQPTLYAKTVEVLKSGKFSPSFLIDWTETLSQEKAPDLQAIAALAEAIDSDSGDAAVNKWYDYTFQTSLQALLNAAPQAKLKTAVSNGILAATKNSKSPSLYALAAKIDDPSMRKLVMDLVLSQLEKAAGANSAYAYQAFQTLDYFPKINPDDLRLVLATIKAKGMATNPQLALGTLQGLYYLSPSGRGPDELKIIRSFLAQIRPDLPGKSFYQTEFGAWASALLQMLGYPKEQDLDQFAKDVDFSLPANATCKAGFASLFGK